jgi:hypothetical protein
VETEVVIAVATEEAAGALGAVVDAGAVDAEVKVKGGEICRLRSMLRRREEISAATIRAAATIETTAAIRAIADMTTGTAAAVVTAAVRDVTTIDGPKVVRVPRHRNPAAKRKFCYQASLSRNTGVGPRRQPHWHR